MKTKHLALAVAFIPAFAASVPAAAEPTPPHYIEPIAKTKTSTTLVAPGAVFIGDTKTFGARLGNAANKGVPGKVLRLTLNAKPGGPTLARPLSIGIATTNETGDVSVTWTCGADLNLTNGEYLVEAAYEGDANTLPSKAEGTLQVSIKLRKLDW